MLRVLLPRNFITWTQCEDWQRSVLAETGILLDMGITSQLKEYCAQRFSYSCAAITISGPPMLQGHSVAYVWREVTKVNSVFYLQVQSAYSTAPGQCSV